MDVLEHAPVFYINLQFDNFLAQTNVTSVAVQIEVENAAKLESKSKEFGL